MCSWRMRETRGVGPKAGWAITKGASPRAGGALSAYDVSSSQSQHTLPMVARERLRGNTQFKGCMTYAGG